jgi:hypothetical protein
LGQLGPPAGQFTDPTTGGKVYSWEAASEEVQRYTYFGQPVFRLCTRRIACNAEGKVVEDQSSCD